LLDALPDARLPDLTAFAPGETSRLRALADRAWQLREDDGLNALLAALERETGDAVTPGAELSAAAASIYLAVGELAAARELLERAAHALTDDMPRSLAGLTLARLGQVRDAQGDRELATRTYRAVLALNHAPAVARTAAEAGLKEPFRLNLDTE
jgi:tetratricopeptide (TPR) repeat protein